MNSLGIDASVRSTGLTFISPSEIIVKNITPKKIKGGERLAYIVKEFLEFLGKRSPDIIIMEGPSYFSTNKPFLLGEVYGLFKTQSYLLYNKEIITPSPKELKKYLCSNGDANKKSMITKAGSLGCPSTQEDICDSFSAALLGIDILKNTNSPGTRKALEVITKYRLGM